MPISYYGTIISLMLVLTSFAFLAVSLESVETRADNRLVFVEDITATWCGYCPSASEGLKDLSSQRNDFRFITLIDDRVPDAEARVGEYNPSGFPTVIFDGGYDEKVGGVSSGDEYNENIDTCLEREVPDIDMSLSAFDNGGSEIQVDVTLINNMNEDYNGIIKVMIVEEVSRYLDADGNNYPNSMLGYAINGLVSMEPGDEMVFTEEWVGAENEDLLGDDFSDIDPENIVVYAVVFNSQSHFKKHPGVNTNTYTAHYADAVAEAYLTEVETDLEVDIISPYDGETVRGQVDIIAGVISGSAVDSVEVKVGQDPWLEMDQDGGRYNHVWDTTGGNNGIVKITVRAHDDQGHSGIKNIEVEVQNEGSFSPPVIVDLSHDPPIPNAGETVNIELSVQVFDTSIVTAEIVVCVDGSCLAPIDMIEDGTGRYTLEIGPYEDDQVVSYHAVVEDSEGNMVESTENIFTVQGAEVLSDDDQVFEQDELDEVKENNDQTTLIIAGVVVGLIIVIVVLVLIKREKQNHKKNEDRTGEEAVIAEELELEEVRIK